MVQRWYKNVILNEITFFSYSKIVDLVIVYITYKICLRIKLLDSLKNVLFWSRFFS